MTAAVAAPQHAHDRHFRTDHLIADLKGRSVRGGAVTLSAQAIKFVLQFGSTAVLSRLLTPADFGLVAMVAAFTGFVGLFKDLGLSTATVQREHVTHAQVSTLFWINVALSLILMTITAALAPAIAWFYGEPRLTWIVLGVAGTFILSGLSAQHTALLRRQMRFTVLAAIDVSSFAVGLIVAVALAWYGFGYWALVAMGAAHLLWNAVLSWSFSGWRPGLPRRRSGVRPMITFGKNLTGFNFVNYMSRNVDNVLIGRFWGQAALGVYAKAYGLLLLPLSQISAPFSSVALPALSRLIHSPDRYRRAFLQILHALCCPLVPLTVLTMVTADWLIPTLLGPQWDEAIGIYRVLGVAALFQTVSIPVGWLFISQGRADEMCWWGVWGAAISIGAFTVGLPWGAMGVATAYAATRPLSAGLLMWYAGRRGPIRSGDLLRALRLCSALAVSVAGVLIAFRLLANPGPVMGLVIAVVLTAATTATFVNCVPSIRPMLREVPLRFLRRGALVSAGSQSSVG